MAWAWQIAHGTLLQAVDTMRQRCRSAEMRFEAPATRRVAYPTAETNVTLELTDLTATATACNIMQPPRSKLSSCIELLWSPLISAAFVACLELATKLRDPSLGRMWKMRQHRPVVKSRPCSRTAKNDLHLRRTHMNLHIASYSNSIDFKRFRDFV